MAWKNNKHPSIYLYMKWYLHFKTIKLVHRDLYSEHYIDGFSFTTNNISPHFCRWNICSHNATKRHFLLKNEFNFIKTFKLNCSVVYHGLVLFLCINIGYIWYWNDTLESKRYLKKSCWFFTIWISTKFNSILEQHWHKRTHVLNIGYYHS